MKDKYGSSVCIPVLDFRKDNAVKLKNAARRNNPEEIESLVQQYIGISIYEKIGIDKFNEGNFLCDLDFIKYCQKFYLKNIPSSVKAINTEQCSLNDEILQKSISCFKSDFLFDPKYYFDVAKISIKYLFQNNKISYFLYIVDNTEDINFSIVEEIAKSLADFGSNLKATRLNSKNLNIIISCRIETFEKIQENPENSFLVREPMSIYITLLLRQCSIF